MDPSASAFDEAVEVLRDGGVVGLPTDTVYGLGVLASIPDASAKLFELKGRPDSVAVAVLVADAVQALALAESVDGQLERLANAFWPGALTVVARRAPGVELALGGDPGTIGLRCPDDDFVRSLASRLGPLAVTSANRHGEPAITDPVALQRTFPEVLVVDGGRRDGLPSTVVSLLAGEAQLLRVGELDQSAIRAVLDH